MTRPAPALARPSSDLGSTIPRTFCWTCQVASHTEPRRRSAYQFHVRYVKARCSFRPDRDITLAGQGRERRQLGERPIFLVVVVVEWYGEIQRPQSRYPSTGRLNVDPQHACHRVTQFSSGIIRQAEGRRHDVQSTLPVGSDCSIGPHTSPTRSPTHRGKNYSSIPPNRWYRAGEILATVRMQSERSSSRVTTTYLPEEAIGWRFTMSDSLVGTRLFS